MAKNERTYLKQVGRTNRTIILVTANQALHFRSMSKGKQES